MHKNSNISTPANLPQAMRTFSDTNVTDRINRQTGVFERRLEVGKNIGKWPGFLRKVLVAGLATGAIGAGAIEVSNREANHLKKENIAMQHDLQQANIEQNVTQETNTTTATEHGSDIPTQELVLPPTSNHNG